MSQDLDLALLGSLGIRERDKPFVVIVVKFATIFEINRVSGPMAKPPSAKRRIQFGRGYPMDENGKSDFCAESTKVED
jgi:hypothetical protein